MKAIYKLALLLLTAITFSTNGQSGFSLNNYYGYLENTSNLTLSGLEILHPLNTSYYSEIDNSGFTDKFEYLDSAEIKLSLTENEKSILLKNHFMVSERLSYESFSAALREVYHKDLPVFVSTDAVLHALHKSYDKILYDIEHSLLEDNLKEMLEKLKGISKNLLLIYLSDC